ncbi:MAG: glutamate-5-semialdehyde dehydrogenase [Firmicutes bacterium]|nr:glutamate-5-semialdehyde dehydrogenase [Bacillota bacterium]
MEVIKKAQLAKIACKEWVKLSNSERDHALITMADNIEENSLKIIEANQKDIEKAKEKGISGAMLDRLTLTKERIASMAQGIREISSLPSPLGETIHGKVTNQGLQIYQVRVPLGVVGIIYEARPNVTADAAALCLKSGNAVVLRGGSEAIHSNKMIARLLRDALQKLNLPFDVVQLIEDTDRCQVQQMMRLNGLIDVLIPRGGTGLIKSVIENATVPVIETGAGNCHIYVDYPVDLNEAIKIIENAKLQRPGVCNAVETVLVHEDIASQLLPDLKKRLEERVELRGCEKVRKIIDVAEATEDDWETEYLDLILAIKIVSSLQEAIAHIEKYSTNHSEAILTNDLNNARRFVKEIDSAAVYVNASTRFTDGSEFGMGAEIGISTQKLHARGPMGLTALTSTKFVIYGDNSVRR